MSKHRPATREEFTALCLRNLGDGMLQINVTPDHVEDAVEEALKYFTDYHYDGTEHVYYAHKITDADIANRFITVPESLVGVTDVFDYRRRGMYGLSSTDMFSFEYQMMHSTANAMENGSVLSYFMNRQSYEFMSQVVGNQTPLRFNRHSNRVHIDSDWNRFAVDEYIVIDGYNAVDPDVHTDVWNDRWLIKYATAKIKYKWGSNLSKYEGMQLPGGITLNGSKIQDDAQNEIQQLEDEMLSNYSIPARDVVG